METMRAINGEISVDDYVAFPTQKYNKGLALQIGQVTELRPAKKAIQVRSVYSTTYAGNLHKQVLVELCVKIDKPDLPE